MDRNQAFPGGPGGGLGPFLFQLIIFRRRTHKRGFWEGSQLVDFHPACCVPRIFSTLFCSIFGHLVIDWLPPVFLWVLGSFANEFGDFWCFNFTTERQTERERERERKKTENKRKMRKRTKKKRERESERQRASLTRESLT